MTKRMKKQIRLQNQAEQVRQRFLVKGLDVANEARTVFITSKDGNRRKALRKYAEKVF